MCAGRWNWNAPKRPRRGSVDIKKVVLCDDDKTTTLIVKHLLTKIGFSVTTANNGAEGLARINTETPDLLILDLDMPVKNGIAVLEELKAKSGPAPYIIVMSAHESPEDQKKVLGLGAREMVIKPFKPADLVEKIEGLVKEGKF
jgi:DNA-binding response OmpR family regulator